MTFDEELEKDNEILRDLLDQWKRAMDSGDEAKAMELDAAVTQHINEGGFNEKLLAKMDEIAKARYGISFKNRLEPN